MHGQERIVWIVARLLSGEPVTPLIVSDHCGVSVREAFRDFAVLRPIATWSTHRRRLRLLRRREDWQQARTEAAREGGLCVRCWTRPAGKQSVHCAVCLRAQRQHAKEYREEARRQGLCLKCRRRPVVDGLTRCAICRERENRSTRRRRKEHGG